MQEKDNKFRSYRNKLDMITERKSSYSNNRPKWQSLLFGFAFIGLLGVLDYLTGDYSLTIFYIIPVFVGAWFANGWIGLILCFVSGVAIITAQTFPNIQLANLTFKNLWNTSIEVCFLIFLNYMFCQHKKELEIEKAMARTDHLTGTLNRRSFMELAEYELKLSRRHLWPITISYIDLDNFKTVNDNLGHHSGDRLLCTFVHILMENIRSTDLVARLGGDEFCILFPETETKAASELLTKIRGKLLDAMKAEGWPVTFSIGAVTYINPPDTTDSMLKDADARMYAVKQTGKDMISHVTM